MDRASNAQVVIKHPAGSDREVFTGFAITYGLFQACIRGHKQLEHSSFASLALSFDVSQTRWTIPFWDAFAVVFTDARSDKMTLS